MKRVLIVNHSNPFAYGGGSYASHAYVKAFSEITNGNIDVCIMAENTFPLDSTIKVNQYLYVRQRPLWKRLLSFITGDIQRYTCFVQRLLRNYSENYHYVVLNGSYEGGALVDICHKYGLKVITIHHNFDPQYAYDNASGYLYKRVIRHHVFSLQMKAYKNSDVNLFLTNDDIELCRNAYGQTNSKNYLIGVFEFAKVPKLHFKTEDKGILTFVITGSLCTKQGIDGILYFFDQLYQYLPKNCWVIIAGRSPAKIVKEYCSNYCNVTLIENPNNMNNVIASGDIYLCPTRLGGGLKLRVMDGLRLGLPVITHSCSSRGYDIFHNSPFFYYFNDKQEFQTSVNNIISLINNGQINKHDIYASYINNFSYESGVKRLKEILRNEDFTNM